MNIKEIKEALYKMYAVKSNLSYELTWKLHSAFTRMQSPVRSLVKEFNK